MRVRFTLLFLTLTLLLGSLCGCRRSQDRTPIRVLSAICEAECGLPDGRLYSLSVSADAEPLTEALLTRLFGNGVTPPALDGVRDAAVFLSFKHPCEFAVFRCVGLRETDEVAAMCLARLAALRAEWSRSDLPEEWATYLDSATVRVRGTWVFLCISSDTDAALRAFRGAT